MTKTNNISKLFLLTLLFAANNMFAQAPSDYYSQADGKKGASLKTALWNCIKSHTTISYDGLWEAYKTTDLRSDGKIWDMYSNKTNYDPDKGHAGNYSKEGDMFNREHSFPKSWFNEGSPMKSDLVHVVPTDGYVNNRRSNYPLGEVSSIDYQSNGGFSKVGSCNSAIGYSGRCFEPNDEYKGDFARIYFYMCTCYEDKFASWSSDMLAKNKYPGYKDWAIKMLLRWAAEDPVSEKEIKRNEGVWELQKNRNPFVDFPGLEQYVWGTHKDVAFNLGDYLKPDGTTPGGDNPGGGDTPGNGDSGNGDSGSGGTSGGNDNPGNDNPSGGGTSGDGESAGSVSYNKFEKITDASGLVVGGKYLIVCEGQSYAMAEMSDNVRSYKKVTISNNVVETETGEKMPHAFVLGGQQGAYTLMDDLDKSYLALTSSDNKLHSEKDATIKNAQWNITFSKGNAVIKSLAYKDRSIQFNASSPRFACYSSSQKPVQLYKGVAPQPTAIVNAAERNAVRSNIIYTLSGQKVSRITKAGVYIVNGRKMMVK